MSGLPDAVFLDRDGTLNLKPDDGDYVVRPSDLVLLPGAGGAVRRLNDAGVLVLLVTNQRGVALGRFPAGGLEAVHARLHELLARSGARLDGVYACPHDVSACECRKPGLGLVRTALDDHPGVDPRRCVVVGDSDCDVLLGVAAEMVTVRIGPAGCAAAGADLVVPDLPAAVEAMLAGRLPLHRAGVTPAVGRTT